MNTNNQPATLMVCTPPLLRRARRTHRPQQHLRTLTCRSTCRRGRRARHLRNHLEHSPAGQRVDVVAATPLPS